jgi:hypothetical protein
VAAEQAQNEESERLRFWRRMARVFIVLTVLGVGFFLILAFRSYFTPGHRDVVAPTFSECRIADDGERLYVAVGLVALTDGVLFETSMVRDSQGSVESAAILLDDVRLDGLEDAELEVLLRDADDASRRFGVIGAESGTLVAAIDLPASEGQIAALSLRWGVGEMSSEQTIPLALAYGRGACDLGVPLSIEQG